MPKTTQHDALIKALNTRNWLIYNRQRLKSVTVLVNPLLETDTKLYIGKMGSLRKGRTRTSSLAVSEVTRLRLLKEGGYVAKDKADV